MITWAFFLFFAGILLILAEIFLPGGLLGGAGVVLLLVSGAMGVYAKPDLALWIVLGELFAGGLCMALSLYAVMKTGIGKALRLDSRQRAEEGYINMVSDTGLTGKTGEVYSDLRPAGSITIDGRRIDAVADGTYIERGQTVKILEVHGNRVVVEKMEEAQPR
jgi:membrane-bound serine protease (ClpP class)